MSCFSKSLCLLLGWKAWQTCLGLALSHRPYEGYFECLSLFNFAILYSTIEKWEKEGGCLIVYVINGPQRNYKIINAEYLKGHWYAVLLIYGLAMLPFSGSWWESLFSFWWVEGVKHCRHPPREIFTSSYLFMVIILILKTFHSDEMTIF